VHVHLSAIFALATFAQVLMMGTLWRLIAGHLIAKSSDGSTANKIGRAMSFQY
jgi:hypothetical protein